MAAKRKDRVSDLLWFSLGFLVAALGGVIWYALAPNSPTHPAASGSSSTQNGAPSPSPKPPASPTDPYAIYLAHNPDPSLTLSREDAQARAVLGCGRTWAPGTVDRALADAYRPTGICR